ncbi:MAG: tRNA (N6-threonylcarbamoyladenosine(37)-N6)-methyltransferase TrmO [Firmicutes bacterium]|nr:tRNA (N6-threonylcarbamoyladenosine(37)-N6)-methyltransferase TrmO [Bacillota bacterium]
MKKLAEFAAIGFVKSGITAPADPGIMRVQECWIEVKPEYGEGLYRIETNEYLTVIFHFHRADSHQLIGPRYDGEVSGVFASRSPRRPAALGVTTVKLLERDGNRLRVKGLDAIDGTPVLDIKPYAPALDEAERERVDKKKRIANPRLEIIKAIRRNDRESLLLGAGSIHGHFCPGLAMGVIAGAYGMERFGRANDGLENLIAIVETNNCFSDGIQYVSGCTFGNNALIYRDLGKTAVTFAKRDGAGLRIAVRPDYRERLDTEFSRFNAIFNKVITQREGGEPEQAEFKKVAAETGFALLNVAFDKLFMVGEVKIALPDYAPIYRSVLCDGCRESVTAARIVAKNGGNYCYDCAQVPVYQLNGGGILEQS